MSKAALTSPYSGQPIPDPGMPAVGDVWLDRAGGGRYLILEAGGETVKYAHHHDGPAFSMSTLTLRRCARRVA